MRRLLIVLTLLPLAVLGAAPQPASGPSGTPATVTHLENAFASGWMLADSNGNGIPDEIRGRIVVADQPTAVDNAAAADFAARMTHGSTGLTLPLVVTRSEAAAERGQPRLWIGQAAVPASLAGEVTPLTARLGANEGGVFALGTDLVVAGRDQAGLLAAAEAYAARAPYRWKVPGEELAGIALAVNKTLASRHVAAQATLAGVTYVKGQVGIRRALLRVTGTATAEALRRAAQGVRLDAVREIVLLPARGSAISVRNPQHLAGAPLPPIAGGPEHELDLATLYTIKGLFGGSPKMPVPASLDGRLYVPAGPAGIAMANLAARLGLESTGLTIPLAFPAAGVAADKVPAQAVIAGDSPLARGVEAMLAKDDPAWAKTAALRPGEGEVRVVDHALGTQAKDEDAPTRKDAVLVRGDAQGAAAAADLLAGHFPNLWAPGKQYLSLAEIRYDLHRFFSLRSGAGQAAVALYHLDRWMNEIDPPGEARPPAPRARERNGGARAAWGDGAPRARALRGVPGPRDQEEPRDTRASEVSRPASAKAPAARHSASREGGGPGRSPGRTPRNARPRGSGAGRRGPRERPSRGPGRSPGVSNVEADVYVDKAYPGLDAFIRRQVEQELHVSDVTVRTGSLHAGMQCCADTPPLHYQDPDYPFHQAKPTFAEDITIPWEGTRLLQAVREAAARITPGEPVRLDARVSEGPEERRKLQAQLVDILTKAGADRQQIVIHVLCAYKQGYSWLMDEIAPELAGKGVTRLRIEFALNRDPGQMSAINSRMRWVQELYPVDEMLAKKLDIPLKNISITEMPVPSGGSAGPTYRVDAYTAGGQDVLTRDFTETTAEAPYSHAYPRYDYVQVETGWVRLQAGSQVVLNRRIETDPEVFWTHYQTETLPRIFKYVMAQAHGKPEQEYQPFFDTLRLDIHMSEPDYNIGLDKERISMLEALQEDTFYSTENFFYMIGDLEMGQHWDYPGRIIPIVHHSEDGKDGHVRVEFYAKPAANPLVRLRWTDAKGVRHERERDLPALRGQPDPRLIEARVVAGRPGVESLTWSLPADFVKDEYRQWLKTVAKNTVEHTIFPVEQAEGQIRWLARMHAAGLYRDSIAYPDLVRLGMEFVLPADRHQPVGTPPRRVAAGWAVPAPAHPRPMIADFLAPQAPGQPIVQWDHPISPAGNARILARLATYPGVNAYWMGRSYLGINIWAADIMLPSPSVLRSWAKETTLKAAVIYSGRQHANEVSSTSHIDKLGEELVTDPATRAMLRQVNVVLHPIDNPDGAQLSVDLYHITPDNLLHPGYHGSLTADVESGKWEHDPIYPESRTRRQLWEAWLPDAFLNPHGYPSHEWVQPFSGYTGWVISRMGAHAGREWWLPRGWFTSLYYLRDPNYPYSEAFTYDLRNRIVDAIGKVPGLMPLENRMNARYERWGQRWDPDHMMQPIVGGVRLYMALKGVTPSPTSSAFMTRFPEVTYDDGYTEAPDETAYGPYMKLMASAGLAYDRVHLKYLAEGTLRIHRIEKAFANGVQWLVSRERPILPSSEPAVKVP